MTINVGSMDDRLGFAAQKDTFSFYTIICSTRLLINDPVSIRWIPYSFFPKELIYYEK
jgi:hypothetical protein